MRALVMDGHLQWREDWPPPVVKPGWAVMRILQAGICRTDIELVKGYMNYRGVLGHEFVGQVTVCDDTPEWIGKRVVGEINAACGHCDYCAQGLGRHCPHRSVLGILNLDGCLADYCVLPIANLHAVPDSLTDDEAVFTEPLSAAFEILEQLQISGAERCLVLGDGKLGILCAWALATVLEDVTLVGHHSEHLERARWRHVKTTADIKRLEPGADIVVEATGSEQGLTEAMAWCRPRGTLVLKSTLAVSGALNLAPIVVQELTVVGSRCGRFERGLEEMVKHRFPLGLLVDARYPLREARRAFDHAQQKGVLKVLLKP